jgi:hypothetical protein
MVTKDRKDKYNRYEKVVEKRKWRLLQKQYIEDNEYEENNHYNTVQNWHLEEVNFLYNKRLGWKPVELIYPKKYLLLTKKFINKYIKLKDNKGIGIILGFEKINSFDNTQQIIDSCFFEQRGTKHKSFYIGDIYNRLQFSIYDIFNKKVKYESTYYVDHKKHILSKEQTNIVNKIIESYYENNNTKSKELTEKKYEADICPICLEEYNEEKRIVTKCGHVFHDECLNQWIEASSNYSCPYCKEIVSSNFNAIFTDEINNIL